MPDAKDFAPNNPVYQKESPEPKYKTLSFTEWLEDDNEDWYLCKFTGCYYEYDNRIRIVEAVLDSKDGKSDLYVDYPIIGENDLKRLMEAHVAEELGVEEDAIIFECKIEIK